MTSLRADREQSLEIVALRRDVKELTSIIEQMLRDRARESEDDERVEYIAPTQHDEASLDTKIAETLLEEPVIAILRDTFGNIILNLNPGSPNSVQHLSISNAGVGDGIGLIAVQDVGGDSNINIDFGPQGTGKTMENGTPLALGSGLSAPDTTGIVLLSELLAVVNTIIADLKTVRIYAP